MFVSLVILTQVLTPGHWTPIFQQKCSRLEYLTKAPPKVVGVPQNQPGNPEKFSLATLGLVLALARPDCALPDPWALRGSKVSGSKRSCIDLIKAVGSSVDPRFNYRRLGFLICKPLTLTAEWFGIQEARRLQ